LFQPVTKINLAVNKLPNFVAFPSTGDAPNAAHFGTIHLGADRCARALYRALIAEDQMPHFKCTSLISLLIWFLYITKKKVFCTPFVHLWVKLKVYPIRR
jgi:hypothetical protein